MSRRVEQAREQGRRDGAAAFAQRRTRSPQLYRRGRLQRAYAEAWDQAWWAAGFAEVAAICNRVTGKIRHIWDRALKKLRLALGRLP